MLNPKMNIFIAKKAPIALILRRGPSSWYHLIKWDLKTDALEYGAWIKGRIYEDYCDISQDGRYFLYKAYQGRRWHTNYKDCYTALSTIPWLKAHLLLPIGGTYGGGGYFVDDNTILIHTLSHYPPHPEHRDAKGFHLIHSTKDKAYQQSYVKYQNQHKNDGLIAVAEWSKQLEDSSIIWHKDYKIYRRSQHQKSQQGDDILIADLKNLTPNPTPSPY